MQRDPRSRMTISIEQAQTAADIELCYDVMRQLRPHLSLEEFVSQVQRQIRESNFRLIYLRDADNVLAVAGIRIAEWLARGRSLEIEDLVTAEEGRSKGYGSILFDQIVDLAKREDCNEVRLVSHVSRYDTHRFYLRKRMKIDAHFFSMSLNENDE